MLLAWSVLLLCAGCTAGTPEGTSLPEPTATGTPVPLATSTPPPSPTATQTAVPTPTTPTLKATPRPTHTTMPSPTPDPRRRVVAFSSDVSGDDDIYLWSLDAGALVRLTDGPAEERDPVLAPDGQSLTYRSNAGGTWGFYRLDLATGEHSPLEPGDGDSGYRARYSCQAQEPNACVYEAYRNGNLDLVLRTEAGDRRLTDDPAGDYAPAWLPGSDTLAFVSWRAGQKDLYLLDAFGQDLRRLTETEYDEESPAWHPNGKRLAFVRWADDAADLYELDLETGQTTRLTEDPYPDRSPVYGPKGTLFWTRYVPGRSFEVHDPYRAGQWQLWMQEEGGEPRPVDLPLSMDVYTPVAGYALWPDLPVFDAPPSPDPFRLPGRRVSLVTLDVVCAGNHPQLSEYVADSYQAWRSDVLAQTGYDVLGQVSDMFRPLGYSTRDYGHLSWHRTGRTVDLAFEWRAPGEEENRLLVMRDDLGAQTYWRLYLKAREQDGSMGEPLTVAPWVFWFDLDRAEEPDAYAAGGRPGEIPPGYYVDLTRLAYRHGWHRIASYEEDDFDWRWDSVGREFWHYQRTDGLTWWQAMLEIYDLETMERTYGWSVCVDELGMDPAWLGPKGVPTPVPESP